MSSDSRPERAGLIVNPSQARSGSTWIVHILIGLTYACLVCGIFSPWLKPYHQPQRGGPELSLRAGDLTPLFSVWTQVAARSIFDRGEWPLWSDHIYCGEPFFAKPQIGVISLSTLLCAVLPAQIVATWTFLLHLWIAGMAMYLWCLDSTRLSVRSQWSDFKGQPAQILTSDSCPLISDQIAAAVGGVAFMLSGLMAEHTMLGHGPIVLVACWTPLVLRFIARAFACDRPVRNASLAGLLVGVQLLAGGETIFLYNVIAGGLLGLAWIAFGTVQQFNGSTVLPALGRRIGRLVVVSIVIGIVGFGLSAVKVLPGLELMPISNRAGGLSLADASGFINEFNEPALLRVFLKGPGELCDLRSLFPVTLLLIALGLFATWQSAELRWIGLAAILLIVAGVAIAHIEAVFALLWHVLPMFRYQRIPQRALLLMYLGVSILISLGATRLLSIRAILPQANTAGGANPESRTRWLLIPVTVAGALLLLVSLEAWIALPELPPTADIRHEVRENHILNHIARQPDQFRIHALESTDRNWGIEHVTVPLGLNNLVGWDHLWLLEYLGAEGVEGRDVRPFLTASYQARHPARFWGLMNVRFITAMQPVDLPGLRLVEKFPVSAASQPRKSAGPFLYENDEWLTRAWIVPHAVLVLGDRAERLEAAYHLMDQAEFDPRRIAVIQSDRPIAILREQLAPYRGIALPSRWLNTELEDAVRPLGTQLLPYAVQESNRGRLFLWNQLDDVTNLLTRLTQDTIDQPDGNPPDNDPPVQKSEAVPRFDVYRNGFVRISTGHERGTLVLAEKFAHFPGWRVETATGQHELIKANAVASAIQLDGSEQWIELTYRPTGFAVGLLITVISLVLLPILGAIGDLFLPI